MIKSEFYLTSINLLDLMKKGLTRSTFSSITYPLHPYIPSPAPPTPSPPLIHTPHTHSSSSMVILINLWIFLVVFWRWELCQASPVECVTPPLIPFMLKYCCHKEEYPTPEMKWTKSHNLIFSPWFRYQYMSYPPLWLNGNRKASATRVAKFEGFRPAAEPCISTIYHAWDTPFWSGTLEIRGSLPTFPDSLKSVTQTGSSILPLQFHIPDIILNK